MVDFWDSFLRMASALAVVLALIAGLVALVRRFGGANLFAPVTAPIVQVLGSGSIGPRKTVSLVSVAGEILIIGMTPTDLVSLGRITDQEQVRQWLSRAASGTLKDSPVHGSSLSAQTSTGKKGDHAAA